MSNDARGGTGAVDAPNIRWAEALELLTADINGFLLEIGIDVQWPTQYFYTSATRTVIASTQWQARGSRVTLPPLSAVIGRALAAV